jgi:Trk K+ transport system NAD-binding subunit
MDTIIFLILRRMRQPLLTLIIVYSVAILGLTLIPGQDDQGNVWYMDFFHATYFVSFMATTIGFGEIPYEFTDAQRMWVTFSLYATVIGWIYALGTLLALVQDKTFQQAIVESRFARRIRHMREPFYLVCGYGETGRDLVRALTERHHHAVVVDSDEHRVSLLQLQNLREYVPGLHGDAHRPIHLLEAGLEHPLCEGVVALTNDNHVNLKIAITAKLLHPDIKVICRADSHDVEANMASFGTDYIIDPFDTFATHLSTALNSPGLYLLTSWLTGVADTELTEPVYPPSKGHWIICGYGRFGKAVHQRLRQEGIDAVVVEAMPDATGMPPEGVVLGRGTEADTLLEAGIERAVGLVAGTDDDANNLSIVMTAQDLNPALFVIARQNRQDNEMLFESVGADMMMSQGNIIANKIRVLLGTPMLYEFLSLAKYQDDAWACELVSRIIALVQETVPEIREITIGEQDAWALNKLLGRGETVTLGTLIRDPWSPDNQLQVIVLMLRRGNDRLPMPGGEERLKPGDRLLLCGLHAAFHRLFLTLNHDHTLNYLCTGHSGPDGWVWRKLAAWRQRRLAAR